MRQITIYKYSELSDEAKARALEHWCNTQTEIFWDNEIIDSFKAVFKACNGVKLDSWSIDGLCGGSWCRVSFSQEEAGDLTGSRAMAWFENNLIGALRVPFTGSMARYGAFYRPGMVKPCPFTGVCYDEDFLDAIRHGRGSVRSILEGLATVAGNLREAESLDQGSESYFAEHAEANNYEFNSCGIMV